MKKENEEKFFLLNQQIESLQKTSKEQNDIIQTQKINIDSLNNIILKKDISIEENEKDINELKHDLSKKKKDLNQNVSSLNEKDIIINNLSHLTAKNSQKITDLTQNVNSLNNSVEQLKKECKSLHNKIDLIGCHDFLRKIFSDFCFLFGFNHNGNYKEAAKLMKDEIKKEDNNSQIKIFAQKVNLIEFLECLGKVIDESDNLSNFFFKELSIEFRNQDISQITNEEIIKENIIKCKNAFNSYYGINFD